MYLSIYLSFYLSIYLSIYVSVLKKNSSKKYILLSLNRKTKNLNKQKGSMQIAIFTNDFRLRLTRYKKKKERKKTTLNCRALSGLAFEKQAGKVSSYLTARRCFPLCPLRINKLSALYRTQDV